MTGSEVSPSFRLVYAPGVMPGKWVRIWNERLPDVPLTLTQVPASRAPELLRSRDADAGLVRLPVDRTVFSAIPLYTEQTVVVVPKDHVITAVDEVSPDDLADEIVLHPLDDVLGWDRPPGRPAFERPATTADAVELVAAGIGVLVVPLSLARLHHRRDLTHRPLAGAPESGVALAWPEDATTDLVDDFIGIVRGRTANSTRGRRTRQEADRTQDQRKPKQQKRPKQQQQQPKHQQKHKQQKQQGQQKQQQKAGGRDSAGGRRTGAGGAPKNPRRGTPRRGS
ncbi:LysR family substrate-binding domain-containing protein [Streptomyces sp. NPDC029526]|uniref:LysR family substrate-binding domain-containing protein n=1 Tax=Streptomyces sp. NPDC029526 TaxID=3155728 RepID=UPI0033D72C3A